MNAELLITEEVKMDIVNIVNSIKFCHSKSIYNKLLSDLSMLYNLSNILQIDDILDVDNYSFKSYSLKFNNIEKTQQKFYTENYKFNMELSNTYLFLLDKYTDENFRYENLKMDYKESQNLASEFFLDFDKNVYNAFRKCIESNRVIYLQDGEYNFENDGLTFYGNNFKPYILIEDYDTIFTSLTLVHEIGHVYDYNNAFLNKNNYTGEIYSHFLELVFADYLKENKICEYKNLKYEYLDNLEENIMDLYKLLNEPIITKLDFRQKFSQICYILEYAYGMILALEFYNIYKKDKELGKYYINTFSNNKNSIKNPIELIDKFKFDKEDIKDGKVLQKILRSIDNR